MKVFDRILSTEILEAIAQHAEREYPKEACGIVLGPESEATLLEVVPLLNVQDRYHEKDPERFPRDAKDAFRIDELARLRVLERASQEGKKECIVYHSHCDAGAYFSPEDRAMAVVDGDEILPGVLHLVISVRSGKRAALGVFRFDRESRSFAEVQVPLFGETDGLPDLESRAMEGREAARPITPVGKRLVLRRIEKDAVARVSTLAEGRAILLRPADVWTLELFSRGALSPLSGFMGDAELASVRSRGRLLSGLPWLSTVCLEPDEVPPGLELGMVVELVDLDGQIRGAIALSGISALPDQRSRLAGPVYVYPAGSALSAADVRAELLRRDMKRVLAAVELSDAELSSADFDGFLLCRPPAAAFGLSAVQGTPDVASVGLDRGRFIPLPRSAVDFFTDAVIAQNYGATHLLVRDRGHAQQIAQSLAISPWAGLVPQGARNG